MSWLSNFAITIKPSDIGIDDAVTSDANLVTGILNPVYMWAGIICVIIIVIAGYLYVTSHGSAANVKKAKDAILGAVIGLVVIILAFTITQLVLGSV